MTVMNVIYSRHSQGKVKSDPVPRELIEKLLSAAVQAPNHFKVRPWRFVVMTGKGRDAFGEAMAQAFRAKFPDVPDEAFAKERQKPLRAPVIIAVAVDKPTEHKIDEIENICAVAAACQNILLAANELGLGAIWRTGDTSRDPIIKNFFGFMPDQHLIGLLYIGYPDTESAAMVERPSFEDRTRWLE